MVDLIWRNSIFIFMSCLLVTEFGLASTAKGGPALGPDCRGNSGDRVCLALKYLVYKNGNGVPTESPEDVTKNISGINKIWRQCGISFQVDHYVPIDPVDFGLSYQTENDADLDQIRKSFEEDSTLLVVTTGTWNRSGSLGSTGANAWTSLPGSSPYGAILEHPVGTFANIVAHELGHYLNLLHVNDLEDLMNPIIYGHSTELTELQCSTARTAANNYWQKMLR